MQWFRMYGEFATDPKVQMLSEADQRRFVMLLCLKSSNGDVTLHDEEVAFQLRVTCEEWLATKAILIAKGLIDERSVPCAWDKRQYASDSSAKRVAAHRAKKKQACNVTVTPPDTDTETDTDITTPAPTRARESKSTPLEQATKQSEFSMTESWEPNPRSFKAMLKTNGMTGIPITPDHVMEFRSFWMASPDTQRTQGRWEHALAQHLKREYRREQTNSRTNQTSSADQRPGKPRARSAVDSVKQAIADRRAAEAAAQSAGAPVGGDDGDLRPPLDGEFRRVT